MSAVDIAPHLVGLMDKPLSYINFTSKSTIYYNSSILGAINTMSLAYNKIENLALILLISTPKLFYYNIPTMSLIYRLKRRGDMGQP